jgi:DNA-binding response OmpR family regulator
MASILIIDDDEVMRSLFLEIVTEAGHEAATAETSEEGRELADKLKPDLILTDIFMPEEGGFEVIRSVKKSSPETKIIAISGFDLRQEVDVLALAKQYGADETFQKPVHAQILTETINLLLSSDAS